MINIKLLGSWAATKLVLESADKDLDQAIHKAVMAESSFLLGEIKKRFRKVQPPNAPSTIELKKSKKPLIDTGEYRNSANVYPLGRHNVYIGFPAASRNAKLAEIHEVGKTIVMNMTEKQRRFLHARFGKTGPGSGTGLLVIHIPARPVIAPVMEEQEEKIPERFLKRVVSSLKMMKLK